jgi:hypothetical protein
MRKFIFLLLLLGSRPAFAIPTDSYLGAQLSYYSTNNLWTNSGTHLPAHNEFMSHDAEAYGGFDFNLESCIWAQAGYSSVKQQVNPDRTGLDDFNLGVYRALYQDNDSSYGFGLQMNVPGGEPRPALRYGAWMGEFYVNYQNYIKCAHYSIDLGYRVYSKNVSDAIRAAFRLDWTFTRRIQITAQGDLDYALFNGKRRFYDNRIAFNPNTRLLKAKILGVYQLTKTIYLNAGYFKHVWGQNVGSGAGVFGGAFWNY